MSKLDLMNDRERHVLAFINRLFLADFVDFKHDRGSDRIHDGGDDLSDGSGVLDAARVIDAVDDNEAYHRREKFVGPSARFVLMLRMREKLEAEFLKEQVEFGKAFAFNSEKLVVVFAKSVLPQLIFNGPSKRVNGVLLTVVDFRILVRRWPIAIVKTDTIKNETMENE